MSSSDPDPKPKDNLPEDDLPEDTPPEDNLPEDSPPEQADPQAPVAEQGETPEQPATPRFGIRGRLKATGVHLFVSFLAFLVVLYFILFSWYPAPHFGVAGGWQGVRIMLFVDLVLGPLMTLVLFNPRKRVPLIVMDLTIIASVQIGAFVWGVLAVHSQRPINLTLWRGAFHSVVEADYRDQGWGKREDLERVRAMNPEHPPLVYVSELDAQAEIILRELNRATSGEAQQAKLVVPQAMVELYRPLQEHLDILAAVSLQNVSKDPRVPPAIEEYRATHPETDATWFVPFTGRYGVLILIFDPAGRLLDAMNDPRLESPTELSPIESSPP